MFDQEMKALIIGILCVFVILMTLICCEENKSIKQIDNQVNPTKTIEFKITYPVARKEEVK